MQETQAWSLGQEDPLEKGMITHSSILAWRIPWTEKPGRLPSSGSQSQIWPSDLKPQDSQGVPHTVVVIAQFFLNCFLLDNRISFGEKNIARKYTNSH